MKIAIGVLTAAAAALSIAYFYSTSQTPQVRTPAPVGEVTTPSSHAEEFGRAQKPTDIGANPAKVKPSPSRDATAPMGPRLATNDKPTAEERAKREADFLRAPPLPEGATYLYGRLSPSEIADRLTSQLAKIEALKKVSTPPSIECNDRSCKITMKLSPEEYTPVQIAILDFQQEFKFDYGQTISFDHDENDSTIYSFTIFEEYKAEDVEPEES
ncbi:MAG: hypothetical protein EOP07_15655 [Proteobacteria bacterium]|nr:MAG: hypothetical protein EOP07_15655 [Pseudomonadota bacterium]